MKLETCLLFEEGDLPMTDTRSGRPCRFALWLLAALGSLGSARAGELQWGSASTLALGGASVAISDGAEALTANPAGLGVLPGWDLTLPLAGGGVQQYNGLLASLSEIQDMLGPGMRFADLSEDQQTHVADLLRGLAKEPAGARADAGTGAAVKIQNFAFGVFGRSTGGVDLRLDARHLDTGNSSGPNALEKNSSSVDAASLTTVELRAGYAHSLLPTAIGHQLYAGGALRLVHGATSSSHTALQEIGEDGHSFRPELFAMRSSGWGLDVDLGLMYAFGTLGRAGLVVRGLLDPGFAVEAAEGYSGPSELSLGRQARFGLGLTPGAGFRLAADVDLNRSRASLSAVEEQQLGLGVEKAFGSGFALRAGLEDNLAESTGLTFTGGVRLGRVDLTVAFSPRDKLLSADQLGAAVSLRIDRLTYPPGR
jgi:F plasmid transfer operon protein TraF